MRGHSRLSQVTLIYKYRYTCALHLYLRDSKSIAPWRRDPMRNKSLFVAVLGILLLQPATGWSNGGHSGGRTSSSSHGSSRAYAGGTSHRGSGRTSPYSRRSSSRFRSTAPPPGTRRSSAGRAASAMAPPSTSSRTRASSTAAADAAGQHTGKGYVNSRGHWVPSPTRTANGKAPRGASARCGDGSYSFSQSHRGTCSHHGGVASWLH